MELEDLKKQLDENSKRILANIEKIENNSKNIQKNSLAFDILKDYKKSNNRLYFILILMLILWVATLLLFHIR